MAAIEELFGKQLNVINVGLASMAESIQDQGGRVVDLDWQPPREDVPRLRFTKSGASIEDANQEWWIASSAGSPY